MWPNKWEKLFFTLHLCNLNVIAFKYFVLQRAKDITLTLMPWLNELVQNQTFSSLSFFLVLFLWSSFSWHTYASLWKVGKSWNAKSIPVCLWNQKNQIFCNRRVQVTSCLPLGPCRSQSDQTDGCSLSKPWCRLIVNVTNFSFPIYFPRQLGWKKSLWKVSIIFVEGCSSCWVVAFGQLSAGEN